MTAAPLLDRAVLDELAESIGVDGARSVIALFLEESRLYLATINAALPPATDAADAAAREGGRRAAHSLKSGAGQIGAAALSAAAAVVEFAAAGAAFAEAVAQLNGCAADTTAALAAFLQEG